MPASPTATPKQIKQVNTAYHDAAADEYDAKWGIDFGETGKEQVRLKLVKALGGLRGRSFEEGLEIGSGTGYFSLNLLQLGVIKRLTATDISLGMLRRLAITAEALGLEVQTVAAEAEQLPFEEEKLRPPLRPRGPSPHPRPKARLRRVPPRTSARWRDWSSPVSRRATETASPRCPSGRGDPRPCLAGADTGAPPLSSRGRALTRPRPRGRGRCPCLRPQRLARSPARGRL